MKWNAGLETVSLKDPRLVDTLTFKCTSGRFRSCADGSGYMFNFNPKTMQFIYAQGWGHLDNEHHDSIEIAHGRCSAF